MYRDPHSGFLYLVMEYIPGFELESLWPDLSAQVKLTITEQLRAMFTQIRSLSPPPDLVGAVCGGSIPYPVFTTECPDPSINGPFKTAGEVASALALASRRNWEQNGQLGWVSGFLSRQLPAALKDYEVHFTHGDLHMRNMLLEKLPVNPASEGIVDGAQWNYRVRGIVDWESAGWYPAYWEYASAVARFQSERDWLGSVDKIIKPYPLEASMILLVFQDLQFV